MTSKNPERYKSFMSNNQPLRIMHMIDSLALGGAERVAVNLCNTLAEQDHQVHLCATRQLGPLLEFVSDKIACFTINKKHILDLPAFWRLRTYVKQQRIQIIHAHSSSYLWAVLIKLLVVQKVSIYWHVHGGKQPDSIAKNLMIRVFSPFLNHVYCVNNHLLKWAKKHLYGSPSRITYLSNFPAKQKSSHTSINLPGKIEHRIVCLANLRYPKNHTTLVMAMENILQHDKNAHLILVGADNQDDYSNKLKKLINRMKLENHTHILGQRTDAYTIIQQCAIGVLSSESEGLPLALLEYGLAGLSVICTNVGECAEVLEHGKHGLLVPAKNPDALADAITQLLYNSALRKQLGASFQKHVANTYSAETITKRVVADYKALIGKH